MYKIKLIFKFFLSLLLIINISAEAQNKKVTEVHPPLDESIRYGKLKNGLSFYIKDLPESRSKLKLHLYVKAGSNYQSSEQLNMAHFIEHMAFKTSKNFPQGLHHFLDNNSTSEMTKFDVNGSAAGKWTEYRFSAPVNNENDLELGLLWFKDIAQNLALTTEDIDEERGVLVQELITRNGDSFSKSFNQNLIMNNLVPCKGDISNFYEHHENFKPETLRKFYWDWYRPESMAVVIVGNIENIDDLEDKIVTDFSDLKPHTAEKSAPDCSSVFFNQNQKFVNKEKLSDSISSKEGVTVEWLYRDPESLKLLKSFNGQMRERKLSLFLKILNDRFKEQTNKYNNFYELRVEHTNNKWSYPSAIKFSLNSWNNGEREAIKSSISGLSQLVKMGVLPSEFEQAKEHQISELKNSLVDNPRYWMDGIRDHFINEKRFKSEDISKVKEWLSNYTIKEFNDFLHSLDLRMPQDIGIAAPPDHPALSYTEKQVRSWFNEEYNKPAPYKLPEDPQYLMSSAEIKKLQEKDFRLKKTLLNDVHELELNNGIKVILKSFEPTEGVHKEKILLHGFSPKGALNFSEKDYFSAISAPGIIKNSGIGKLDKFEFQRYISNKSLWWGGIKPYVKNQETGIEIDGKAEDFETMLQVVYLLFTDPGKNQEAFNDWKFNEMRTYENQHGELKRTNLDNNISKIIDDFSGVSIGTERYNGLEKVDYHRAHSIFNELFGNSAEFTFIITGNFKKEKFVPLINKYLGNLTSNRNLNKQEVNSFNANLPLGPLYLEFYYPRNFVKKNAMFRPHYISKVQEDLSWKERMRIEALGAVIDYLVWDLRFKEGYSLYNTGARGSVDPASGLIKISASFNCVPAEIPSLRRDYAAIVSRLKKELISEEFLSKSLDYKKFLYAADGKAASNKSTNERLHEHFRYQKPIIENEKMEDFLYTLTPEDILQTAQKYLLEQNLFEFVMKKRN